MALKILYQSKELSRSTNESKYKVTYYGKQDEIDAYIATLEIGVTQAQGKTLTMWHKSNYGADLYQVETEYTETFEWGSYSNVGPTVVGKKSATLSVRNLQLPLEHLDNYLCNWNNILIQLADSKEDTTTPDWWYDLGKNAEGYIDEIPDEDADTYRWIKSAGERPTQADSDGKHWYIVEYPTKPGVEYYDWAVFVVTQSARYRSPSAAGQAVSNTINTITGPTNDFGLGGGGYNWKHDEASIQYDGKAWIVTNVYTLSGDALGWDEDIYG